VSATPIVAVLAGGAGRRMGGAKAIAPLGGRPLIAWPLAAAAAAGLEAVVVAKRDTALPELAVPVWHEPDRPRHPLLGIVTALEHGGRPVVACGCDQPWLPAELLAALAGADGAAAPYEHGAPVPLPARYPVAALGALRDALAAEAPLRRTVAALDPAAVPLPDPAVLANVNTPEDLARVASRAS
jgi:molybdenum cofactor guanylyltransferase